MDWKKSKKILIIALLITNFILIFNIYLDWQKKRDETLTSSFIKKTEELLLTKDIKIDTKIPKVKRSLPSLSVEFEDYEEKDLNNTFFQDRGLVVRPSTDRIELSYRDRYINLVNNRRIFYENAKEEDNYKIDGFKDVEEISKEFLIDHGYDIRDMVLSHYKEENGRYYINYSKIYEDIVVESSYTNFIIDKRGVVSMDRLWLRVLKKSNVEISVESATRALLGLMDREEARGKIVKKISECFYFNPEDQGYVEDITRATQGRAIPAWKIEFQDGENIVIDSY